MEILLGIAVGLMAGGVACWLLRTRSVAVSACLAVGVVGALVGLATDTWLSSNSANGLTLSEIVASSLGAVLVLALWTIAQRLFLSQPRSHNEQLQDFSRW